MKEVLTVDEAAAALRIGRGTAYEAIRRKELPAIRLGRRLLVPRAALERMLEAGGAKTVISSADNGPEAA